MLGTAATAQSLVGYWPFDGDGADRSGGGRHLNLAGGVGFAAGMQGQALDLHANPGQFAQRPGDDAIFDFGANDFTIQVWINFHSTGGEQVLVEKFSGSGGPGWTLTKLGGDQLHFYCQPAIALSSAPLSIPTATWHQVIARRNGTRFQILFNGAVVAQGFSGGSVPDTSMPLLIGKRNQFDGRNFPVDGRIDSVAIWDYGLSDPEVAAATPVPLPIANAGGDQTALELAPVTLDASASSAPGGVVGYLWSQVAGPAVGLNTTDPVHPTFVAPAVPVGGSTLTFQLVVFYGDQILSVPDTVNVTVTNVNNAPHALAGDDFAVTEGSPTALDGSGSYDPDDDFLTYTWLQTAGPVVVLDLADPSRPAFVAPLVGSAGAVLTFQLTVYDGIDESTDSVNVLVENSNHAPTADAGADQTRVEGTIVTLNGGASQDPDADALTFSWQQLSGPAVALTDGNTALASFVAPDVGAGGATLVFRLLVDDGNGGAAIDDVVITVQDGASPPPLVHLARPSQGELWPPNHKLVPISILGVTDPQNQQITITIVGVTQDEPIDGLGDGDTAPDAVLQGSTVLLRAERAGGGNGRVYRVTFHASTPGSGVSVGHVNVCVPPSKSRNAPPSVDDGQVHGSTGS